MHCLLLVLIVSCGIYLTHVESAVRKNCPAMAAIFRGKLWVRFRRLFILESHSPVKRNKLLIIKRVFCLHMKNKKKNSASESNMIKNSVLNPSISN